MIKISRVQCTQTTSSNPNNKDSRKLSFKGQGLKSTTPKERRESMKYHNKWEKGKVQMTYVRDSMNRGKYRTHLVQNVTSLYNNPTLCKHLSSSCSPSPLGMFPRLTQQIRNYGTVDRENTGQLNPSGSLISFSP